MFIFFQRPKTICFRRRRRQIQNLSQQMPPVTKNTANQKYTPHYILIHLKLHFLSRYLPLVVFGDLYYDPVDFSLFSLSLSASERVSSFGEL